MTKIFYVIKWILGSLLFLLILDLVVEPAVVAPNQKGYQDGTKLSEQRFLPETSTALYVEEENHAPKLNQISRKRVKRGASSYPLGSARFNFKFFGKDVSVDKCSCPSSTSPQGQDGLSHFLTDQTNNEPEPCGEKWINQTSAWQPDKEPAEEQHLVDAVTSAPNTFVSADQKKKANETKVKRKKKVADKKKVVSKRN
ncbi:unnamed protein product [Clavelina lepadiformis]|uniref:Uncharacterized protein n=1 Tax=Clavelina lepadiformis TaxID=159417 RepID=A0ABP0FU56_CLALP